MKKTLVLFGILVMVSIAAFFVLRTDDKKSSLDLYDRSFSVENIDDIYRIVITKKNNTSKILSREGRRWKINEKYLVGEGQMKSLLDVIHEVRINYIPHNNAIPNIIKEMGVIGLKVEMYDKNDELFKSYYIGGSTSDERGTYMLMDGADQPYVMDLARAGGSFRGRYLLSEKDWRDKTFLEENPKDIKLLKVDYPKQKNKSFVLDVENNSVYPLYDYSLKKKATPRNGSVKAYLRNLSKIGAEYIDSENLKRDSINQLIPMCKLTIEYYDQEAKEIKFIPLSNDLIKNSSAARIEDADKIERYYADCSWGDLYLVQQILVGKLFMSIDFFY